MRLASDSLAGIAILAALLLAATALQWSQFRAPLLEGAAGKQTHMAMVARNFADAPGTFLHPRVDDVGTPGYFVKELPVIPWIVGLTSDDSTAGTAAGGRRAGWLGWLAAALLVARLARRAHMPSGAPLAVAWMLFAPLALAYGPAFQNDQWAVAASLAALLAMLRWRAQPDTKRALACIPWLAMALLLKPHTAFWLAPAALVVLAGGRKAARPEGRAITTMLACGLAAGTLALPWYLHALAVHREFPIAGASVTDGWVNLRLLLEPYFWAELARQVGWMVLTPVGAVLAGLGWFAGRKERSVVDASLVAWTGGVILQDVLLATRIFDTLSRGTEYYQMPLLVPAAIFIARGTVLIASRLQDAPAWSRAAALGTLALALLVPAFSIARDARQAPARYGDLLADCDRVRRASDPGGSFVVLGDRGGTVLYYCERRGLTYKLAGARTSEVDVGSSPPVDQDRFNEVLAAADYVYFPYPELVTDRSLLTHFETWWDRVPTGDSSVLLFRNRYRQ